eukprot:Gregarina_sp_Pseudo_9__1579@NODE_2060_length_1176_cov_54_466139_g1902_i0_p1_GENE_NODE_2060_length_1176_cov_54_466139_g1902_i0NODE_2060_length_1176_cov_54_466139_g1902_i0_p1_ORF_typecomplete_len284_score51_70Pribosyltran/PF00156_27/1_9e15Pribosyl_synth/PF14572_6/3_7e03Pribosyl_synth/PF14572_6/0_00084PRTase_3/PF15610_6/0_021_NODE_2060_length_1176_cov_54_466139_g1902_i047853
MTTQCESLSTTESQVESHSPSFSVHINDVNKKNFEPDCFNRGLYVSDEYMYPKSSLVIPPYYESLVDGVIIPKGLIIDRIEKLALDIHRYYSFVHPTEELNLICTLKGAVPFFEYLTKFLRNFAKYNMVNQKRPAYVDHYVKASSYVGMSRQGDVQLTHVSRGGHEQALTVFKDKDLLIIEDILDSGNTLEKMRQALKAAGARSVTSTVLFAKRVKGNENFKVEWTGFSVPNKFILGFGCDLDEHFRDLEHLCVISEEGRSKYLGSAA